MYHHSLTRLNARTARGKGPGHDQGLAWTGGANEGPLPVWGEAKAAHGRGGIELVPTRSVVLGGVARGEANASVDDGDAAEDDA